MCVCKMRDATFKLETEVLTKIPGICSFSRGGLASDLWFYRYSTSHFRQSRGQTLFFCYLKYLCLEKGVYFPMCITFTKLNKKFA